MGKFFEKLLSLEILHAYYVSGKSHDFTIEPTTDTLKKVKGLRMILKAYPSEKSKAGTAGIDVVYEATDDSGTPLLPVTSNERLRFTMKLNNPGFLNFTTLTPKTSNSQVYYYTNDGGNALSEQVIELRPKVFLYQFNFPGAVTELLIKSPQGLYLSELTVTLSGGPDYEVPIDLSLYPDGKYTLELFNGITSVGSKEIYFDNVIKGQGIFGIIELVKNDNIFDAFTIGYASKQSLWKYFVVVRDGTNLDDYSVIDNGPDPANFALKVATPDEERIVAALLANLPDADVALFESDAILFSETKRKDIQLIKDGTPDTIVINHLPNPSVQKAGSDVYVYV